MSKQNSPEPHKGLERYLFLDADQWESWLSENHKQFAGVWIQFAKKASGKKSISYEEAREVAIRFGWIDGLINTFTEQYYLRKFTPRRPGSNWSKINRRIAEQLIKDKRMEPAGLAEVNAAKADGRWDSAYDSPATIEVPEELQKLLDENKKAKDFFATISRAERYSFLYRIQTSKRPETRRKHIEKALQMLARGEVYHPTSSQPIKKKRKAN